MVTRAEAVRPFVHGAPVWRVGFLIKSAEGTYEAGIRTLGDNLLQAVQDPGSDRRAGAGRRLRVQLDNCVCSLSRRIAQQLKLEP